MIKQHLDSREGLRHSVRFFFKVYLLYCNILFRKPRKNESFIIIIIKPFLNAVDNLKIPLKSILLQMFSRILPQIAKMFVPFCLLYQHFRIIRNSKYPKVMEHFTLGTRLLYFTDLGNPRPSLSSQLLDG